MNKKDKIFKEFVYAPKLRFNEIEKKTGIRSNELAYFLKKLVDENVLSKEGDYYCLTSEAEKDIPFFREGRTRFQPAVVLVKVHDDQERILLVKRSKRPYENKWSLPGGCMLLGEALFDAAKRVVKEKVFLKIEPEELCAITHDLTIKNKEPIHGFVLLLVKARPTSTIKEKDDVQWFKKQEIPEKETIPSDYYLATGDFNKINYKEFITTK